MVVMILFLARSSFTSSISIVATITNLLEQELIPHDIPIIFADHGQEVSITLDSAQFIPLTTGERIQVSAFLNYRVNDPSIVNQRINSIMKVYWPNQTQFKTSSSPEGFIINETGSQRHATTITNSKLINPIAVIQFADLIKTMPISNPLQIELTLNQSVTTTQEQAVNNGISSLPLS
jgi:hypothetical protein